MKENTNLALSIALKKGISFYLHQQSGDIISVYENNFHNRDGSYVVKWKGSRKGEMNQRQNIMPGETIHSIYPDLMEISPKAFEAYWRIYEDNE